MVPETCGVTQIRANVCFIYAPVTYSVAESSLHSQKSRRHSLGSFSAIPPVFWSYLPALIICVVWVGSEFAERLTIQGYIVNANQAFRLNVISL